MKAKLGRNKESGSGLMEYIVILSFVLGFFLFVFWGAISEQLEQQLAKAGIIVKLPGKREKKPPKKMRKGREEGPDAGSTLDGGEEGGTSAPVPVLSSGTSTGL